jgi:diguanylate cyclase (GGDEF)-like protein/PAS domain S-box-containing protein
MMNRLRIPQKFLVLAIIYLVAVAAVGISLYRHLSQVIATSQRELDGITSIVPITKIEQLLQMHRGLSAGFLGGESAMGEPIAKLDAMIHEKLKTVAKSGAASSPALLSDWTTMQSEWNALQSNGLHLTVNENFVTHSNLIKRMETFRRHIADTSGLSMDPDIDAHYLLDTAIIELPGALEEIAQIRGLGTAILAKKASTASQTLQLHALLTKLSAANQRLTTNLEETSRYNPAVHQHLDTAFLQFNGEVLRLLERVQTDIIGAKYETSPGDYFTLATSVIDAGYEQLFVTMLPTAARLVQARLNTANDDLVWSAGIELATLLIVLYLFAGIYFSTKYSISALAQAAAKFASGDLTQRTSLGTRDEIAQVGESFNQMADGFGQLLVAQQEGEERLQAIVNSALDAVIQMDDSGRISGWNQPAETIFGWTKEEAIGRHLHETIIPERYRERHLQGLKRFLATGHGPVLNSRVEVEGMHREGHEFPIELAISSIKTVRGVEFNAFARDITQRRRAEAELRISAIAFETDDGIVVTDGQGKTLNANQSFSKITGYRAEEIIGQSPFILKSRQHDEKEFEPMWKALSEERAWQGEIWSRRKNGEEYPEWIRVTAVVNDAGKVTNYVVSFSDITQRKKFEETIHRLAFYDPLTDLPNRRLLMDRLQQRMGASSRSGLYGAILLIDLDHFKTLNDTKGHETGDLLLVQVAQRLNACVREGDTVSRLGGDEFVVLLGGLNSDIHEAATQIEVVGRKILTTLSESYVLGTIDHRATASIGATLYRGNESTADDLFKQADLAMYKSKDMGRNGLNFFDPVMQTAILERSALEAALREAIVGNQLLLHYQPQVTDGNRVTGAEALVRWLHPQRGMVSPAEFIPLAEETGLILTLGNWVLNTACDQLAAWQEHPQFADLTLAVNVSAKQFHESDFVEQVSQALARSGASPRRLKLELTESLLVADVDAIVEKMYALKAKGVGFSLDDFGTGYSSLAYLKRLPLDQLKIDQSFVRNILVDPNDAAIARTIVALAQSLGLAVIAEGVETQAQHDFLASVSCHAFQGYFFSRPMVIQSFEKYVLGV